MDNFYQSYNVIYPAYFLVLVFNTKFTMIYIHDKVKTPYLFTKYKALIISNKYSPQASNAIILCGSYSAGECIHTTPPHTPDISPVLTQIDTIWCTSVNFLDTRSQISASQSDSNDNYIIHRNICTRIRMFLKLQSFLYETR